MQDSPSPAELIGLGTLFIAGGAFGAWAAVTRFTWLKEKMPFLCQWGRGSFRWRASRPSMILGASMAVSFGAMMLTEALLPPITHYLLPVILPNSLQRLCSEFTTTATVTNPNPTIGDG
jgi:hypothetical protein